MPLSENSQLLPVIISQGGQAVAVHVTLEEGRLKYGLNLVFNKYDGDRFRVIANPTCKWKSRNIFYLELLNNYVLVRPCKYDQ